MAATSGSEGAHVLSTEMSLAVETDPSVDPQGAEGLLACPASIVTDDGEPGRRPAVLLQKGTPPAPSGVLSSLVTDGFSAHARTHARTHAHECSRTDALKILAPAGRVQLRLRVCMCVGLRGLVGLSPYHGRHSAAN